MQLPVNVFSPQGGMNQDDSIVSPTRDAAGRNIFGLGDYKYALNSRIGSSRSDNFGDLENLKGTVEVTNYRVRSIVNTNSDFASGLTGWSQIAVTDGTPWVNSSGVKFIFTSLPTEASVSDIIYQAITPTGKRMGVRLKVNSNLLIGTVSVDIIFLNGSTVLETRTVIIDSDLTGLSATRSFSKYINEELPSGCNQIGVQAYGTTTTVLASDVELLNFEFFDWISGTRPVGTEKAIGKYENREFNQLFYAVYNSSGNHCIRYYDPAANAIFEILRWSGLSFATTYFESMAMVDNFIAMTDRNNSPRIMDVYSISDLFLTLGSEFREYHISFHTWAPTLPPVVRAYWDLSTNNYLKFQNKTYQFSYRYIYQSNLRSRWSPISGVGQNFVAGSGNEVTAIELFIPGSTLDDPGAATEYNYFNNDDEKFTAFVKDIEIGYRESSLDVWRIMSREQVKVSGNTVYRFYGDSNSTPIPTDDFFQLFDTVPFLAGAIEAIDNRFMFGDCLDEQEAAPPVQVTDVGVVTSEGSAVGTWWNFGTNSQATMAGIYSGMTAAEAGDLGLRNMINDTTFKSRGIYKLGIVWLHKNGWRSGVYTVDAWSYEIPAETTIIDKMYALTFKFPSTFRPPDWAVGYQIVRTNCLNIDSFLFGAANLFQPLIDDATQINTSAQSPQDIRDAAFQYFENARSVAGLAFRTFKTVLKNKSFFQAVGPAVRKTSNAANLTNASRIFINVNNWYNSSIADAGGLQNNPMNKLFYNYREGDRVRFLGSTASATPTASQKQIFDVPILEFTGNGILIEKPPGLLWVPIGIPVGVDQRVQDLLIEVYTPKVAEDQDYLYNECGEWYPVLYPGTEDRDMSKRDWTYTNNASITCSTYGDIRVFNKRPLSNGDCHGIQKTYYFNRLSSGNTNTGTVFTASMNPDPNNSFDFWEKCDGRIYPAYTDLPIAAFKTTQVRFGGQIVEQSFVNQLTRFKEEYQKIFPSEYGRIRALVNTANAQVESVGAILLAIGERETFSIYVNRTTLEDLSGNTQVALSDRILGSYNTLLGSHGTLNPESISVERGRVYYWDGLDGCWVRYGRDGLTEISFYKMRNWFRDLAGLLINYYGTTEEPLALSGFDPFNEELVTYQNHSGLPGTFRDYSTYKGAMFSEEDTRWKSIHSYDPELIGKINSQLVSFRGGSLYLHEQNSTRSTFYGTKRDVMVEPVFNEIPKNMKSWQFIAVVASHKWSVQRFLSEYRGAKTKQQSSIPLTSFEEKEDAYYADIKMDQNTPNVTTPLINGAKMRSKALRSLMVLDPAITSESLLQYVQVGPIDSPKNP
jgi:hypothetical protein